MCIMEPYPPGDQVVGPRSVQEPTPSGPALAPEKVDRRNELTSPLPTTARLAFPDAASDDSVKTAVTDAVTWLLKLPGFKGGGINPGAVPAGARPSALAAALQAVGVSPVLPPRWDRLSAWRTHLKKGLIVAEMYVDDFFLRPDTHVSFGDRLVDRYNRALTNPYTRAVIVVGSMVDPADTHPDHPSGRYLIRSGLGKSWASDGHAWVAQGVARYRFIRGFPIG